MGSSLVIFDLDLAPRELISCNLCGENGFYDTAIYMLYYFSKQGIHFSLETILHMKSIYQQLSMTNLPKLHPSVDITEDLFKKLSMSYMALCARLIEAASQNQFKDDKPDPSLNLLFKRLLQEEKNSLTNLPSQQTP